MKHWSEIKVGDLVRCKVMPNMGIGLVVKVTRLSSGQASAMCHWSAPNGKFTYFLDQLTIMEEK